MVMRDALDGLQGRIQIGWRIVTNVQYADDVILLATSEAELQELVDCLDWVIGKYSLLINVDKTKVMASDGIECCILFQNEQLEQVYTFPYLGSLITEDVECTTKFYHRLNGAAIGTLLQKIWKSHSIPISMKIRLMTALVWPLATYGCESWTPRKYEETRLDDFDMNGLRKILRVLWTAKKQMSGFLTMLE